jgi:quercetin dioxygenase-like cupin family protein
MKRIICICVAALVVAGAAYAAPKPPITAQPLGVGHLANPFAVSAKPGDLVFVQVKIRPGGDFGWHFHRSAVAVAVLDGTLTLYDSSDPTCAARRVSAGQAFTETARHVHLARNEGTTPVRVLVAYLGAPHDGKSPDVPAAQPRQCPSVS